MLFDNLKNHKKMILEARKSSEYKSLQKKMAKIKEKEKKSKQKKPIALKTKRQG